MHRDAGHLPAAHVTRLPVTAYAPADIPSYHRRRSGAALSDLCQHARGGNYNQANYPRAQFQLVEDAGIAIGRLYVDRWADQIRIIDVALLPEYRGRGAGTWLINQILNEGRQLDLPVTIHVERFNPALRLYERLGFQLAEDKGVYLFLKWTP